MREPYSKQELHDYFFKVYIGMINYRNGVNKNNRIPLKICNISGEAGECLAYYLIIDGRVKIPGVNIIEKIILNGDSKSNECDDDDDTVAGDIVITHDGGKITVVEVKTYSTKKSMNSESKGNKNAHYILTLKFVKFREDKNNLIDFTLAKNENIEKKFIENNQQTKLYLHLLDNHPDAKLVDSFNLHQYLTPNPNFKTCFENDFFSWDVNLAVDIL